MEEVVDIWRRGRGRDGGVGLLRRAAALIDLVAVEQDEARSFDAIVSCGCGRVDGGVNRLTRG